MRAYSKPQMVTPGLSSLMIVTTQTGQGDGGGGGGGVTNPGQEGSSEVACNTQSFGIAPEAQAGGLVTAGVRTTPASGDLNGCVLTFNYGSGCTGDCQDVWTLPTQGLPFECGVTDQGSGVFSITCLAIDDGTATSYNIALDCSAKNYGTASVNNCPL